MQHRVKCKLHDGAFIPAHPLALNKDLTIDEATLRRLTRYYIACGVNGLAVGVHTTQFEIRDPEFNYLEPVLKIVADEIDKQNIQKPFIKVAGVCGETKIAIEEAKIAQKYGYHLALLSMGGLNHLSETELLERARQVAEIIPLFGFYLQPAVGGRVLSYNFWRQFCEIENVQAIKVAAFNRYQTLDVVRAVCHSSRCKDIALYTGNDDNIINDLITPYSLSHNGIPCEKRFVGGLLGHYSVWTRKSVELFIKIKKGIKEENLNFAEILKTGIEVTDMNSAIFDVAHSFKGSIAGIHEVLKRQGLMKGIWCLSPKEKLSEGQDWEITRVLEKYTHLTDNDFVKDFLEKDSL
ncbi:dihydrodipicolinate synthase family protein [Maribellus sp. YY47]|uniref:dihydrodipicolinate synthase family protein n=1 Tax=Maribellus sp. YY47 TaxID=2929486 RepID=UPI002000A15B|nr:dihydrodipicolinate synthase family protein [Maribellus sp. YY47]MCK3684362.1 dihydrodipicolinate synthase family protein [Maribellus sp. YY47]